MQLRVVDGDFDIEEFRKKLEDLEELRNEANDETVYVSPVIGVKDLTRFLAKLDSLSNEVERSGLVLEIVVEIGGSVYKVEWEVDEWNLEGYEESPRFGGWVNLELGKTVKYRWLDKMKEAFEFLNEFKPDEGPYVYSASEAVVDGIVIPGGSLYYHRDFEMDEGFFGKNPTDLGELLELVVDFYKSVRESDSALVAVTDGEKSRILLELLLKHFDDVRAVSFWREGGCETAKGFGIECEVVDLKHRNAHTMESYLFLKASEEGRIPVWGAEADFLIRHHITVPRVFTPFWFLEKRDLVDVFDVTEEAFDDVLDEVV